VRARARARVRACRSWKSILHVQTRLSWSSVVIFHTNAHAHTCTFTYIYITRMRHCTWYVSLNRCHARDIYPFVYPESISAQVYFRHKTARSRRLSRGHIILLFFLYSEIECQGGHANPCSGHGTCQADGSCTCQVAYAMLFTLHRSCHVFRCQATGETEGCVHAHVLGTSVCFVVGFIEPGPQSMRSS
jgi:hypothetical protein